MRIGRHMPTHSRLVRTAELAQQIGCEAIQIFASNPTGWNTPNIDAAACYAFAQATQEHQLAPVVLHAPYLINLGSPDDANWEKSIALLTWTLQKGELLGAQYVVFHTGSHRGSGVEAGIARIVQGITRVLPQTPPNVMLLLENDVGAGNALGHSFEQLAAILALLPEYAERLGVCLDTAHLWGAGHDISDATSTLRVLQHFDETVGIPRLKVLHLNDTEKALGSHRDVHTRLGEGIIGSAGLHTLLTDPRLAHVAVLMETPIKTDEHNKEDWDHDTQQVAHAKMLAGREIENAMPLEQPLINP
ncbi:MAG TPA: deoxyribonuclease IV [Ktedonobacteraceae bacterium]|jgi:deoxyribonuclease-4|nr:deoxyribonuclease IV [Ktedonobacteraceae bacterium]